MNTDQRGLAPLTNNPGMRTLSNSRKWFLSAAGIMLFILLPAVFVFASSVGPVSIPFRHTAAIIMEQMHLPMGWAYTEREGLIVSQVRLPRVLVGALVGAALGISGAAMQGLFRNPLVEPGYVGVSSGAALGAVTALFFGWTRVSHWILPGAAFIGALAAISIVLMVWKVSRKSGIATLLLLGVGINSFLSALISIMIASSRNEEELRSIVYWLQGGLEARTWEHVQLIGPFIVIACLLICSFGRDLNVMLLGDDQARNAGVNVKRTRILLLGLASLTTGVAVAVSGIIGFVGLIIPHTIRLLIGPDHRLLLPLSAIGGAVFLMLADVVSRMMLQPITLQVGVVCACIGAPLFIFLILRKKKGDMSL